MPSRGPRSSSAPPIPPDFIAHVAPDVVVLDWPAVGRFTIRPRGQVQVEPARGAPAAVVREFARGPVAAIRSRQQGRLVLHGSAVAIGKSAVVLCGGSGWGKSTLAAALLRQGHRLLADDFAVIRTTARGPVVDAGPSGLKLWPDSAQALGLDPGNLPRVHPQVDKRRVPTRRARGQRPVRLSRVVILAPGAPLELATLGPPEALIELLRHSYGARTLAALHAADHFARCAALVRAVPVARLRAPRSLAQLPRLVRLVEEEQV